MSEASSRINGPTSVNIFEEGANLKIPKIVSSASDTFDRGRFFEHMLYIPGIYPSSSGCTNIKDIESDLKELKCRFAISSAKSPTALA